MGTEDFKKFMDEVRTVQKDMVNKKPGSIRRARIIVNKLRLQRLNHSFMESAIHDAEKNIPKKDW